MRHKQTSWAHRHNDSWYQVEEAAKWGEAHASWKLLQVWANRTLGIVVPHQRTMGEDANSRTKPIVGIPKGRRLRHARPISLGMQVLRRRTLGAILPHSPTTTGGRRSTRAADEPSTRANGGTGAAYDERPPPTVGTGPVAEEYDDARTAGRRTRRRAGQQKHSLAVPSSSVQRAGHATGSTGALGRRRGPPDHGTENRHNPGSPDGHSGVPQGLQRRVGRRTTTVGSAQNRRRVTHYLRVGPQKIRGRP